MEAAREGAARLQQTEWEVQQHERRVEELTESLDPPLEGSAAELRDLLRNFEAEMQRREEELQGLRDHLQGLERDLGTLRGESDQLILKKGQGEMLMQQAAQLRTQQSQLALSLQRKYSSMPPFDPALWDDEAMRSVLQCLENEVII